MRQSFFAPDMLINLHSAFLFLGPLPDQRLSCVPLRGVIIKAQRRLYPVCDRTAKASHIPRHEANNMSTSPLMTCTLPSLPSQHNPSRYPFSFNNAYYKFTAATLLLQINFIGYCGCIYGTSLYLPPLLLQAPPSVFSYDNWIAASPAVPLLTLH